MPVYRCKIAGSTEKRLVRAKSAAQARAHLVEAETISADTLAEEIENGTKLETATVSAEEPEPVGDPPVKEGGGESDPPAGKPASTK